jgi:GT2 family glycosyltransferase
MMSFVVAIATSGRSTLLGRTLESLADCALPHGYGETVIVENGPRDGAETIVRSAPRRLNARYLHVPRPNKSAALNAVLETIDDGLVFFTDDDVRFAPATLCAYASTANRTGPGHFFGGPTGVDYETPPPNWLREFLPISATGWEPKPHEQSGNEPIGATMKYLGFNWAAFSRDLCDAGGFNPNHGPGSPTGGTGQESEMHRRLMAGGSKAIYVPDARVWHFVPRSRCSPEWTVERTFRNGVQDGLFARVNNKPGILPPRWIVGKYLRGIIRAMVWSISSRPEVRFKAKIRRSYDRGLLRGALAQIETGKPPEPRLRNASKAA